MSPLAIALACVLLYLGLAAAAYLLLVGRKPKPEPRRAVRFRKRFLDAYREPGDAVLSRFFKRKDGEP